MDNTRFGAGQNRFPAAPPAPTWLHQPPHRPEYAGFWRRFFASLLDGLVPGVVGIIPSLILGQVFATDPFGDTLWLAVVWFSLPYVVSMIINWLYFAGF
ncbi:MAG: hypothetical protein QOF01_3523, partial [Thermomicrobiales bacterium]|nr:hypothetical protein [Thermomicrobiales bacterium]